MTTTLNEDELECTHNCEVTLESLREDQTHFLDCPVWVWVLGRKN